jgi:hypothetical protein
VAVSVFPEEIYAAPRRWAARAYPTLIYDNTLNKGGHFAAWEQPQLFSAELRAAFKSLRELEAGRRAPGLPVFPGNPRHHRRRHQPGVSWKVVTSLDPKGSEDCCERSCYGHGPLDLQRPLRID